MSGQGGRSLRGISQPWVALVLCAGVAAGWAIQQVVPRPADEAQALGPDWLPLVAAAIAAAGIVPLGGSVRWLGARQALRWSGLLLLVWTSNGFLFDVLTAAGLMGHRTADGALVMSTVYWPGLATRTLALAAVLALARLLLARPPSGESTRPAAWYGYLAFVLALPYPVLRVHWALGGTLGLRWSGAAGEGWEPLLVAIPWLMAAALSLLLVSPRRWVPRRLLLAAGWSATAIVATIGPAAVWALIVRLASGGAPDTEGIELCIFALFYGCWLLWAIVAAAATRSYQLRSVARRGGSVAC